MTTNLLSVIEQLVGALEDAIHWRNTGAGRPPEQTCMDAIAAGKQALEQTQGEASIAKYARHLEGCLWNTPLATGRGNWHCTCGLDSLVLDGELITHPQATEPAPSTHAWSGDPSVQDYASTQPAPSTAVEREAWLIEVNSLGPSWICSVSRENGFTRDANEAIQFPTKESAEGVLGRLWKSGRNGTVFGLDQSCYSVTEHIFLGVTPATHDAGALVEALDSIRRYGLDTLSGRTDGPDDRDWQRQAVNEMTKRASAALLSAPADHIPDAGKMVAAMPVGELTDEEIISMARTASTENFYKAGRFIRADFEPEEILTFARAILAAARTQPVRSKGKHLYKYITQSVGLGFYKELIT